MELLRRLCIFLLCGSIFDRPYLYGLIFIRFVLLMQGEEEKKHGFVFPKKEELIDEIKLMEDDIENISLNLVKCDFNAI